MEIGLSVTVCLFFLCVCVCLYGYSGLLISNIDIDDTLLAFFIDITSILLN